MINKEQLLKAFEHFDSHSDDYLGVLYINIFKEFPLGYRVYFDKDEKLTWNCTSDEFNYQKEISKHIYDRQLLVGCIEMDKIQDDPNIVTFCYSYHEWLVVYENDLGYKFLMNITLGDDSSTSSDFYIVIYTNNISNAVEVLKPYILPLEKKEKTEFGITAVDPSNSLYTSWYDYTNHEIDIEKNYNDDIPYDKMCSLIESEDKPELMLFYGEPGTGKSSLIKHFISKYPDKDFVFMDGTLMANVQQEKLMSYFLESQNTIFILEDCEKVLMNREHYVNPVMPILLNLTDGIIGDVLGIKLICTFNTSLNNIDKALIRKGRLSLKYEFKKLTKDKVENIVGHPVDKEMTLADIYYEDEENDYSKKTTNKIGF